MMATVTGGEAVVKSLLAHGVETIFGLPGVQNDYFYNALYDEGDRIRVIHSRHEQGAAYMALGYALSSERVGIYSVVPGPGFLNTTAALSTAYARNARVLCLTGQIPSNFIGRGVGLLHEIPDQLGIIRSLTKWAARANSPAETPGLVAEAFKQLRSGRPRPVGLEIPMDVLSTTAEVDLAFVEPELQFPEVDSDAIDQAAKLLGEAKNPMIFVGSGAVEAAEEVKMLAEALQAPVIASGTGLGVLSSRHYLSLTPPAGYMLWERADVVLAVGTRLQAPLMNWGTDEALKTIKIDLDPEEHERIAAPTVRLVAHSRDALQALIPAVEKYNSVRPSRRAEMEALEDEAASRLAYLEPQLTYIKLIREELPEEGLFVDEVTQIGYVSRVALPVYRPRSYITPSYQGTLGYGFATALGVKVANPDKPVLSVTGDGGFMFTMPELSTAVKHRIGLVTVIFNDGAFGNVRRMQKERYNNRVIATDLHNPDFVKLAESFGAQGLRAETPEALRRAIRAGFETGEPTLIDVPVGEMPDPWGALMLPKIRGK
jgi:acetolactate synthase I/II/III large subunit